MRRNIVVAQSLLATALALPELALQKKSYADFDGALPERLARRAVSGSGVLETNPYSVLTWSSGGAYYANVTVGTPEQNQVVILDTGSSDLYFDASTAPACQNTASRYSCRGGTYDHSKSSTYNEVAASPAFNTSYGDGSTASGPYGSDVLGIGDVHIQNVQFGVAEQVKSTTGYAIGLMGVGYSAIEATGTEPPYPNVPEILRDAGVINSRLYSVYLNDVNTGSGSILFGGVDTSKFNTPMVTVNILPDPYTINQRGINPTVDQFITTVTALKVNVGGKDTSVFSGGTDSATAYGDSNKAIAALVDTGSSAWSVPSSYYSAIVKQFPYVDSQGLCACKYRDSGDTLTLTFAGKLQITVPAQEFIIPIYNATTRQAYIYDTDGNTACNFMISKSSSSAGYYTLGDAIMRSMYVVFDLDNGQLSMAQANVNSTQSSNIVKIPSGANGVASAVSGVSTAAKQTVAIASQAQVTQSFIVSTATTTIGAATGADAVPTEARVSGSSSNGGGSGGSGGSGGTTSKAAASSVHIPAFDMLSGASLVWSMLMAVSGALLLL